MQGKLEEVRSAIREEAKTANPTGMLSENSIALWLGSVDWLHYHGIRRGKNFFEVTDKGVEFVSFFAKMVSSLIRKNCEQLI